MLPFNGLASRVTGRRGWLQAMDFSGYNPRLQCEVGPDAGASPLPFTGQRGRCPSGAYRWFRCSVRSRRARQWSPGSRRLHRIKTYEANHTMMRSHYCGQLNESLDGQEVTLCGWVHRRRDHGGVIFLDVRDREGLAQVVFDPDRAETFAKADRVRSEFVVKITGSSACALKARATRTWRLAPSRYWATNWKC